MQFLPALSHFPSHPTCTVHVLVVTENLNSCKHIPDQRRYVYYDRIDPRKIGSVFCLTLVRYLGLLFPEVRYRVFGFLRDPRRDHV